VRVSVTEVIKRNYTIATTPSADTRILRMQDWFNIQTLIKDKKIKSA
jgi:hypothetical protein